MTTLSSSTLAVANPWALVPSLGNLDAYISAVNRMPMLTLEQEQEFARKLKNDNDLEAAGKLVLSHLRLVVSISRQYLGYGLPHGDLIQEGNIGLMKAVKRFDPDQGVRLVSYALHWIKAEIHEYILKNWRMVKVATTKAQRKLFFNLRSAKKNLGWLNNEEAQALARDLGVEVEEVRRMEGRLAAADVAFDAHPDDDDETASFAPAHYLEDRRHDPATQLEDADWETDNHERLGNALECLDDRSRVILQRRWLDDDKATLHELAAHYGVSAERIRQLEQGALKKLRSSMLA